MVGYQRKPIPPLHFVLTSSLLADAKDLRAINLEGRPGIGIIGVNGVAPIKEVPAAQFESLAAGVAEIGEEPVNGRPFGLADRFVIGEKEDVVLDPGAVQRSFQSNLTA